MRPVPSGAAEAVEGDRVDGVGIGVVPFHVGRDLLLADEHLGADRPRRRLELAPGADAHVDHRLARLEPLEQRAQLGGTGLRQLGERIGEDVDQLAADEQLRRGGTRRRRSSIDELPTRAQRMPMSSTSS